MRLKRQESYFTRHGIKPPTRRFDDVEFNKSKDVPPFEPFGVKAFSFASATPWKSASWKTVPFNVASSFLGAPRTYTTT